MFSIHWLARALETLAIIAFATHNASIGTNPRAAEPPQASDNTNLLAYNSLVDWWHVFERVTAHGGPPVPLDSAAKLGHWLDTYATPSFLRDIGAQHLRPCRIPGIEVLREVSRLVDLGLFVYFVPLPEESGKPGVRHDIPRYEGEKYHNGFPRVVGEIYRPGELCSFLTCHSETAG